MKTAADVPEALAAHRAELERLIATDLEAAVQYAGKVLELRQDAAVMQAELSGIDRAITAYRDALLHQAQVESVAARHGPPRMVAGTGGGES